MLIKNIAAKVIGIGSVRLLPGSDFTEVPDEIAYVPVFNTNGEKTGETEVLPSLRALERMNQIVIVETRKKANQDESKDKAPSEEKKDKAKKSK